MKYPVMMMLEVRYNNSSPQQHPTHTFFYADENWSNDLHNYHHLYIETECIFSATHNHHIYCISNRIDWHQQCSVSTHLRISFTNQMNDNIHNFPVFWPNFSPFSQPVHNNNRKFCSYFIYFIFFFCELGMISLIVGFGSDFVFTSKCMKNKMTIIHS